MRKTTYGFEWGNDFPNGHYIRRIFTRSFDTLEAAQRFAEGKDVIDIFRSHGRYKVEWQNVTSDTRWD